MSTKVDYKKPKLNNKLINCVLEHIEREVAKDTGAYNQNLWADIAAGSRQQPVKCGTRGCFAGWACLLSTPLSEWKKTFVEEGGHLDEVNDTYDWSGVGRKKLGLTHEEAEYLFGGANSALPSGQLEQIKERIDNIRRARRAGVDVVDLL